MRTHAELHVIIPSQTSGHNTNCMDGLNVNLPDIDSSEEHSEHRLNGGQLVRNAGCYLIEIPSTTTNCSMVTRRIHYKY